MKEIDVTDIDRLGDEVRDRVFRVLVRESILGRQVDAALDEFFPSSSSGPRTLPKSVSRFKVGDRVKAAGGVPHQFQRKTGSVAGYPAQDDRGAWVRMDEDDLTRWFDYADLAPYDPEAELREFIMNETPTLWHSTDSVLWVHYGRLLAAVLAEAKR